MSNEQSLKACPFCGSEAILYKQYNEPEDYNICCSNYYCDGRIGWARSLTRKEAIKAWNTRPIPEGGLVELDEKELSILAVQMHEPIGDRKSCVDAYRFIKAIVAKFGQPRQEGGVDEENKKLMDNLIFVTHKMEEMEKKYFEAKAKLSHPPKAVVPSVEEILVIIKDYCDGPYSVTEDGSDANGKTYLDFAQAIRKLMEEKNK